MATTKEAIEQYIQDVQKHIRIDEDKHGRLVCAVPSSSNPEGLEDGAWHIVSVDDKTTVPHAYYCSCEGVATYRTTTCCRHMSAVGFMYSRIYKSNVAKLQAKLQAKRDAKIEQQKRGDELVNKTNINSAQQSSGFWGKLPSRQPVTPQVIQ